MAKKAKIGWVRRFYLGLEVFTEVLVAASWLPQFYRTLEKGPVPFTLNEPDRIMLLRVLKPEKKLAEEIQAQLGS